MQFIFVSQSVTYQAGDLRFALIQCRLERSGIIGQGKNSIYIMDIASDKNELSVMISHYSIQLVAFLILSIF
jgi:hypothetical protein